MDHYYQNIQGWTHFLTPLYDNLIPKLPSKCKIAEIGVWRGRSTSYMAVELTNQNKDFTVFAVDHWLGCDEEFYQREWVKQLDPENDFRTNLAQFGDRIQIIKKSSVDAAKEFEDGTFDFVIIDDDHSYDSCRASIEAWYPKVKIGGYIGGDDFGDPYPGVEQAVRHIFSDNFVLIQPEIKDLRGAWFHQRS